MADLSRIPREWLYPASLAEAAAVQRMLSARVSQEDVLPPIQRIHRVAGTDVSNNPRDPQDIIYAALALISYPDLKVVETSCVSAKSHFSYVPGFLAFRETPVLVAAFARLLEIPDARPDVLMVDGHGISHPRGLGIASHLGVLLDWPTIGVAKSILVGHPEGEPGNSPGDHVPLVWRGKQLGVVLRTRKNVQPVYVSVGHKVSLETAIRLVVDCLTRYRLPEPTRQAHIAANICRREMLVPEQESLSPVFDKT
ncbi:MAG TPA: deoxyribonuclease V [Coleofasciculaceae cyanobacterium]